MLESEQHVVDHVHVVVGKSFRPIAQFISQLIQMRLSRSGNVKDVVTKKLERKRSPLVKRNIELPVV